jgi:ABC-2 type transport system ATP-binding protein
MVDGDGDGLLAELQALPGLTSVRAVADGRFELETAPGPDVRPQVASTVVNGGWKLLELRRERMSLEEIFIQLTREEAAASEAGEAEALETVGQDDGHDHVAA